MLKKQMEEGAMLRFFKKTVGWQKNASVSSEQEANSEPSTVRNDSLTVIENPSTVSEIPSMVSENLAPTSCSNMGQNPEDPPVFSFTQISDRYRFHSTDSHGSSPSVVTSIGSPASVDQLNTKLDDVFQISNKILSLLQSLELGKNRNAKSDHQPFLDDQPSWFQ